MRLEKRMGLKVLRLSAVVVAFGGLCLLHLYARSRELPVVRIAEISPVMNFANVRIAGTLESGARKLRSGSVLYVVDDGTGTIAVFADSASEGGSLPPGGSRVEVSGNLSVGAGNEIRMRAHRVDVVAPGAVNGEGEASLSSIAAARKGERVTVCGRVSKVWRPDRGSKAPHKIVLADGGGTLEVVHWLEEPPIIVAGDRVKVSGTVGVYKDKVQLKVWETGDVVSLE